MNDIDPIKVLSYYDGPLVFLAIGNKKLYICYLVEEEEVSNSYLCTAVDGEWLEGFMCGNRDLRDTVVNAPSKEHLLLKNSVPEFDPDKCTPVELNDDILPEPGFKVDFQQMLKDNNESTQSNTDDN